MSQAHAGTAALPSTTVHLVQFENITVRQREPALQQLMRFLGWGRVPSVDQFFEEQMTAERAHVGRWQEDIDSGELLAFAAAYRDAVRRLRTAGVPVPSD